MSNIALVHEWLVNWGGSEVVLESLYEIYKAPIYTLFLNRKVLENSSLKDAYIYTSFLQKIPFIKKTYKYFLLLFPLAIEQFNLSNYEIIISSSHAVAKGILTKSDQIHVCYCHTPMRYIWDLYFEYKNTMHITRKLFYTVVAHYLRIWDVSTSNRVDYFIANSKYVANRIKKIYRREAKVIYPPVDITKFEVSTTKENFYITISRLVPYKRIDLIINAFKKLPDKKLIIIGQGPLYNKLKKSAPKNVELLGFQPFNRVKELLKKAKAFIYAAEEDFGIAPVEAQACGTPVIALNKGGTAETIINEKTGILFNEQNVENLINAIRKFEQIEDSFDAKIIRKNAERFSKDRFKTQFLKFINSISEKEGKL